MENKDILMSEDILVKNLGWHKDSRGIFIKRPYPFAIKQDKNSKEFQVVDLYFPNDGLYSIEKKSILSIEDYNQIMTPILKETGSLNHTGIIDYQINCLMVSYGVSMESSLTKIKMLDEIVKSNQIRRFINQSFSSVNPLFRVSNLTEFLELKFQDNSDLSYIQDRLKKDDELSNEIKVKCKDTEDHLKQIFESAQPG
ncbi:hypothetical protein [Sphingobacterium paucimobilis]|uniref:Uncharacterized protein n=1 Tax=Sphingobacterium paucimobilis HER1398 TaxID=1346330 RepID=U2HYV9_9SPHI|nr:hypothetical protein [Sphingobacterium paucimobilis]ERJ60450.1 hypothetical protein M472_16985 [Sphingobacterium paucimobilis HER1398]